MDQHYKSSTVTHMKVEDAAIFGALSFSGETSEKVGLLHRDMVNPDKEPIYTLIMTTAEAVVAIAPF